MDAAKNSTIQRNRRLALTMVRISNASSVLTGDLEFCAPQFDRADGYHLGAGWRARTQDHHVVLVHLFDADGRTYVGQRPDDREDPGLAFLVINEGGLVYADIGAVGLDERGLELDAVLGLFGEDDPRRLLWACRLQVSRLVGLGQGHLNLGAGGQ